MKIEIPYIFHHQLRDISQCQSIDQNYLQNVLNKHKSIGQGNPFVAP